MGNLSCASYPIDRLLDHVIGAFTIFLVKGTCFSIKNFLSMHIISLNGSIYNLPNQDASDT